MRILPLSAAALLSLPLAAPASFASAPPPASQVIELWSYGYAPSPIRLVAGRPVTLTFVNRAGKGHDFTAHAFFANSLILAGAAPRGEVDLAPGERKSITLVPRAGSYRVHCGHFFHAQLGMRGVILVG